jgi:predicted transcriptional regulator
MINDISIEEIKKIRKSLNLTQLDLAKEAGVSQSLIAKIESKNLDPTYSNVKKIISAINRLSNKTEEKANKLMNKKLVNLFPNDSIKEAIIKMKKFEISQLPIIDENNKPIGYISENILLDSLLNNYSKDDPVNKIMIDCPPTINQDSPVSVVYSLLKHYPMVLVTKNGILKGIITKSDLIMKMYDK